MKVLFDANTPAPLLRFLAGHEVLRVQELGWHSLENGRLLDAAEKSGFDVLLTCDQNIRYQQNYTGRKLALVIISTNHWPSMKSVAHRIASAINFAQTGQIIRVSVDELTAGE